MVDRFRLATLAALFSIAAHADSALSLKVGDSLAGAGQRGERPFVDLPLFLNGEPLADVTETSTRCGAIRRSGTRSCAFRFLCALPLCAYTTLDLTRTLGRCRWYVAWNSK